MDQSVFDHEGPWTEAAYLDLPRSDRVEVVEGTLLVGPGVSAERAAAIDWVRDSVAAALPDGLVVRGPVSLRLGPANGSESSPSTAGAQIVLVSPQVFQFLNDNSSRLPDLPFSMVVFATAVGTADNSDQFEANRVSYQVLFTAQSGGCAIPTPTPGESIAG